MYHCPVTKCDSITVTLVIAGSEPPKSLKTFSKTGTRKVTSASRTVIANPPIMIGYIIADLTWRLSESSFSSWSATRWRVDSRMPPSSPASTIAM